MMTEWKAPEGNHPVPPVLESQAGAGARRATPGPKPELLRSLGGLVRGLSALFWGLPAALVVCFHAVKTDNLKSIGAIGPLVCTGLLLYGLWQLGDFQRQERVWRNALDRAGVLAMVNFGLSPFLYWSSKIPGNVFFTAMVLAMAGTALLFLASLNQVLRRLGAILPDEGLRTETKQFTILNLNLLLGALVLAVGYFLLTHLPEVPVKLRIILALLTERGGFWFLVLLIPFVLLPLAMTMALLWKTKEVILENVFGGEG
jgi:hypothetical protein